METEQQASKYLQQFLINKVPKVLLISNNEICYNARLVKAADFFSSKSWDVVVLNPIVGLASEEVYNSFVKSRNWEIIENDISKRTIRSKINWFLVSLLHRLVRFSVEQLKLSIWSKYYLNKGLLLMPKLKSNSIDLIIVNLIDNLPFAAKLKRKYNSKLLYDSQEYFVGQYAAFDKQKFEWVKENEAKYISQINCLLATTQAMLDQLMLDYQLAIPSFRVRNLPFKGISESFGKSNLEEEKQLKLVWHGMGVFFNNRRGVHIVLKALSLCKANVHLYLQGNINNQQMMIYKDYERELGLEGKVTFLSAAHPDHIVESLMHYDIGLAPELPEERNQELTSSNKLFDYIHAGLAVISSDVIGLSETIEEYKVGKTYEAGDAVSLASFIDELANDHEQLNAIKRNSLNTRKLIDWQSDYIPVYESLI